jgi:hypothetical protein
MGGLGVVMDIDRHSRELVLVEADGERIAYEDEDHVYTLCIAVESIGNNNDLLVNHSRRRIVS